MVDAPTDSGAQRERAMLIFTTRPRCPVCHCARLLTYRTSRHGDDSITRHARCADCGQRVFVVVE